MPDSGEGEREREAGAGVREGWDIPRCETARHGGARPGKQTCHIKNPVLNVRLDGPRA